MMSDLKAILEDIAYHGSHLERLVARMCLNSQAKNDGWKVAVDAERERCAKVVETLLEEFKKTDPVGGYFGATEKALNEIRS